MHAEGIALAGRVEACGAGDAAAGGVQLARQILEGEAQLFRLVPDHAIFVLNLFHRHIPDGSRPLDHLALDVFRRENGRPTGRKGRTATAGDHGEPDRVRVNHLWLDFFVGDAKGLRRLLRDGSPGASDIHRPLDQVDRPVRIDRHVNAGMEAPVHPKAGSDAAPAVRSCQRRAVVLVVTRRFQAFHQADLLEHRTLNLARTLGHRVVQAEFHRVHAQLLADFVHDLLHSKSRLW